MQWSRHGADLLLQVRFAVYNGVLASGLNRVSCACFAPGSTETPGVFCDGGVVPWYDSSEFDLDQ
jgi:hypothetical protein